MKNWVAFHGNGKVQLISMAGYFMGNLIPSQSFKIEFGCGACGLDMSAEEPNFILDFLCRGM